LEEDFGKKCQRWVVTRDSAWRWEHDDCNIAVFKRILLSILHSQSRKNHLFGRKNRMVQPDSLNVGYTSPPVRLLLGQVYRNSMHLQRADNPCRPEVVGQYVDGLTFWANLLGLGDGFVEARQAALVRRPPQVGASPRQPWPTTNRRAGYRQPTTGDPPSGVANSEHVHPITRATAEVKRAHHLDQSGRIPEARSTSYGMTASKLNGFTVASDEGRQPFAHP
jgi:hypothetical protein